MGEKAKYALVLWDTKPGTLSVIPRGDIQRAMGNNLFAKWEGRSWPVKKVLRESDDRKMLEKEDYTITGTPWRKRTRAKEPHSAAEFRNILLNAHGLSDDERETDSQYPCAEEFCETPLNAVQPPAEPQASAPASQPNLFETPAQGAGGSQGGCLPPAPRKVRGPCQDAPAAVRLTEKSPVPIAGAGEDARKMKRPERIRLIYEISDDETEDEAGE